MQEKTLGEIIAEKRRERRLTQAALASHLGISDKAVSKWERNQSRTEGNHMVELVELLDLPSEFLPQGGLRLVDTEETEYLPPLFDAQQDKSEAGPQTWRLSLYDAVVIVVVATLLAVKCWNVNRFTCSREECADYRLVQCALDLGDAGKRERIIANPSPGIS